MIGIVTVLPKASQIPKPDDCHVQFPLVACQVAGTRVLAKLQI